MEDKEQKSKKCPFLNCNCIKEECAIYVKLQQMVMGVPKVIGTCSLTALVLIASTPLPTPSQGINLPDLLRG